MDDHQVHPKCVKQLKAVSKILANAKSKSIQGYKYPVPLEACGSKENNALLALLRCETKHRVTCQLQQKLYDTCHASVMGVGTYENKSNCSSQLAALRDCVKFKV
ncbi:hypothetical protein TrST_g1329 [Triparma strigata]|uniref:Uncharacterized protein n=1 Tax=Triparma strigata TaxID=1606541 RepID=A0A9W7EMG2_9STRA|nr:hypothetical protein TrST_g1329 [Triparma strigata]